MSARTLVNLGSLTEDCVMHAPGCSPGVVLRGLRDLSRSFCDHTEVWVDTLSAINITAGTTSYAIPLTVDAFVKRVMRAEYDGAELGATKFRLDHAGNTFHLLAEPQQNITDGLTLTVALVPTVDADDLPVAFLQKWRDAIVAGTVASLKGQRGNEQTPFPWYDPVGKREWDRVYSGWIARALHEKMTVGVAANIVVRPASSWL